MATKQKQKQKQTVIVNIGSTVVKKRKRKPRKKKSAAGSSRSSMPPPPPPTPSMDLRQVLYPPQPQLRGDDNLAIQLNSVTKQLQDLQDKQQHRTANLIAGARAIAREEGAQGSVMEEVAPQQEEESPLKKKAAARRTKQQIQDDEDAAAAAAAAAGEVPKPKRVYVKKQTKAEEAAAILLQQSGVIGRRQEPSLADYDGGSGMSSVTMTPGLYPSPAFESAGNKPVKKLSVRSPTETPETTSLSGTSLNSPSAQTEARF